MQSLLDVQNEQLKKHSAQFLKNKKKLEIREHRQADEKRKRKTAGERTGKREAGSKPAANALNDLHAARKENVGNVGAKFFVPTFTKPDLSRPQCTAGPPRSRGRC
jgi:hypothetical protein